MPGRGRCEKIDDGGIVVVVFLIERLAELRSMLLFYTINVVFMYQVFQGQILYVLVSPFGIHNDNKSE